MAKTNFTKMEEVLSEALHKIHVEHLLKQADAAQGKKDSPLKSKAQDKASLIRNLQRDLKRLHLLRINVYKQLGLPKKSFNDLLNNPERLTDDQWDQIEAVQAKIDALIAALPISTTTNEELVKNERFKHINKRFNVNEKWLPLK